MNWITQSETFQKLLGAVEREFGVPGGVQAPGRSKSVVMARHALWWLLRRHAGHSYPEIGSAMEPARDHTTVMSGIASFERRLAGSAELIATIARVEAVLVVWAPASTARRVRVEAVAS